MSAIDTEWDPFPLTAAEGAPIKSDEAPEVEAVAEEVTTPKEPHAPTFRYVNMPPSYRIGAVPEALRQFMVEEEATGYTPPFYVDRGGSTKSAMRPIPGCPPIEPDGKALVFDDWGNPRVIKVTGIHNGEIRGMLGSIEIQCQAWIAMKPEAPLTVIVDPKAPARLTDEEAAALEAEINEWSKFLGWRADKYGWCGTFENILRDMGVEPWRPGFKTVTLQVDVRLDAKDIDAALVEKIGGKAEVRSATVASQIVLTDVSREDYENSRWLTLLEKAGYKNMTSSIRVLAKEAMTP